MKFMFLMTPAMENVKPDNIKVLFEATDVQVLGSLPIDKKRGSHILVEGEPKDIVAWLTPFVPFYRTKPGTIPQMEEFIPVYEFGLADDKDQK